jgi:hypothetical protein
LASTVPTAKDLLAVSSQAWSIALACFFFGNFCWTLLEYGFHRFLFHVDRILPDTPAFLTLHFLMHGVHHYLPMDRFVVVIHSTIKKPNCPIQVATSHAATTLFLPLFPYDPPRISHLPSRDGEWYYFWSFYIL